ncbi:MAG: 50S ribosomal protein L9 [Deltaproteobacteria bacterium]|jgi:large subunit ribosomal protein L9|nr:50S ribosomal protein L9 [Deltaproteobacteria bacterium]
MSNPIEIILTQDVASLGMAGQVLKVAPGYARNYLLPGSFALPATPANLKRLARKRAEFEERSRLEKENALVLKKTLEGLTLTITRKSVEKGRLYGAVTPQDIVDAASAESVAIDRRRLKISEPIKSLGDYDITVRIHPEVTGSFRLRVVAERAAPDDAAAAAAAQLDGGGGPPDSETADTETAEPRPDEADGAPDAPDGDGTE